MPLMLPTRRMPQAATEGRISQGTATVDFDTSVQTLSALQAAAYRLIGTATCQIEQNGDRFVCHLVAQNGDKSVPTDTDALRVRFLYLVTDENLRARVQEKTEGVRNVILALAFGSLAASQNEQSTLD